MSILSPLGPFPLLAPPAPPGRYCPTAFPDWQRLVGLPQRAPSNHSVASFFGPPSVADRSNMSLRRCMKLFVKSNRPSFPPVPSNAGKTGLPSSCSTMAASIHWRCGPLQDRRSLGTSSALHCLKCLSASARRFLYSSNFLKAFRLATVSFLASSLIRLTSRSASTICRVRGRLAEMPSRNLWKRGAAELSIGVRAGSFS